MSAGKPHRCRVLPWRRWVAIGLVFLVGALGGWELGRCLSPETVDESEIPEPTLARAPAAEGGASGTPEATLGLEPESAETLAAATRLLDEAASRYVTREVAPQNRGEALRVTLRALGLLDALDSPDARRQQARGEELRASLESELEMLCSRALLAAKRHGEFGEVEQWEAALKAGLRYFTVTDHPCRVRLSDELGGGGPYQAAPRTTAE